MTERTYPGLLALMGALRSTIGIVGITTPETFGTFSGLDTVTARRTDWLVRTAAVRDLALGVGQVVAVARRRSDPGGVALWAFAGALADAGDVATLGGAVAAGRIAPLRGGLLIATAAVAVVAALPALTRRGRRAVS